MAVSWSKQKNVSEVAAKLRTDLGLGTAALADADDFYTKGEVDGYRTTDQNAAKDAGNLTTGTVPDARLPGRLSHAPAWTGQGLTDCNAAIRCGWYFGPDAAANKPASGDWVVLVSGASPDSLRQDAYNWVNGHHYKRSLSNGTWAGWDRVFETAAEIRSIVTDSVKAWVNFNGTGTVAIRASMNVSSITDNGVGDYTVNFATPLADGNYAVALAAPPGNGRNVFLFNGTFNSGEATMTASGFRVGYGSYSISALSDINYLTAIVTR